MPNHRLRRCLGREPRSELNLLPGFPERLGTQILQRGNDVERNDFRGINIHNSVNVFGANRFCIIVYQFSDCGLVFRSVFFHGHSVIASQGLALKTRRRSPSKRRRAAESSEGGGLQSNAFLRRAFDRFEDIASDAEGERR